MTYQAAKSSEVTCSKILRAKVKEDVGVEWVSGLYLAGHIGRGDNGV